MEVAIFKDSKLASQAAANLIARTMIERSGKLVLGLATGSTPLDTYSELVRLHRNGKLSFKSVRAFNLDEYVGLSGNSPHSYKTFMQTHLFSKVDIDPRHCHIPDGKSLDPRGECLRYEESIRSAGGIDLQLLGLGQDGHLGFNEPSSSLSSRTRLKTLTESTRRTNAVHFGSHDEVPHHVLTMGLGTIMEARRCVLLAFGEKKADAVARMVEGPLGASHPASILQMHQNCTVILDETSASQLKRQDYYREVFSGKPEWQRWDLPLD